MSVFDTDDDTETVCVDCRDVFHDASGTRCGCRETPARVPQPRLATAAPRSEAKPAAPLAEGDAVKGPSEATVIADMASALFEIGVAPDGRAYAFPRAGASWARPLDTDFSRHLASAYRKQTGKVARGGSLTDAIASLIGDAEDNALNEVSLRTAHYGTDIVIDLADETGRAVVVTAEGWDIVDRSPVPFRRPILGAETALPAPERGGSLLELRSLVNLDDRGFQLFVAWILCSYIAKLDHPVALLTGTKGSSKSTLAEIAMGLVDPSPAPLRKKPRERDWNTTADKSWGIFLDNVSSISEEFSDSLCRVVTGEGAVDRTLHTNDSIRIRNIRRVIMITSIEVGGLRDDLSSRMIAIPVNRVTDYRDRGDVLADFFEMRPRVFGALLDVLVCHQARVREVKAETAGHRLAGYVQVLRTLDAELGWSSEAAFLEAANDLVLDVLDSDVVAAALRSSIEAGYVVLPWRGTARELLVAVDAYKPATYSRAWPGSAGVLSGRLKRLVDPLRAVGIDVRQGKSNGEKVIWIDLVDTD